LPSGDTLEVMSRRQLYQDLAAVRALVADGRERMRVATGDLDQFWLNSARRRLATIDEFLIGAAGGLGGWSRALIGTAAMLVGAAVTALVTGALGFSTFWVVACSWLVALAAEFPARRWIVTRLAPALGRRRLAGAAAPIAAGHPRDFAGLLETLATARVRLVSVALRAAGTTHWRPRYLARAAAQQPASYWLAEADTLLCQAIDHLERYLADETKEPT